MHHWYQRHWWQIFHRYQWQRRPILPPVLFVLLTPVANFSWCQWYRRQTTPLRDSARRYFSQGLGGNWFMKKLKSKIWWHCPFKVNLKAKIYIYVMLTLLPKGVQTKLLQFFWLMIFSICHRCQRHQYCHCLPQVSTTLVANNWNLVLRGTDSWKKPDVKNFVALSLKVSYYLTVWRSYTYWWLKAYLATYHPLGSFHNNKVVYNNIPYSYVEKCVHCAFN